MQTISEGVDFERAKGRETIFPHVSIFFIVKISTHYFCNLNKSKLKTCSCFLHVSLFKGLWEGDVS